MNRTLVALIMFGIFACEETELSPPEIHVDINVVYMGIRVAGAEEQPYEFNLQFYNRGEETLEIESVKLLGDQNCALQLEGPDVNEIDENGSAFIRFWYKPLLVADDQVALEVKSNSHINGTLIIPMCGRGTYAEGDPGEPPTCNVPPRDQPGCPKS